MARGMASIPLMVSLEAAAMLLVLVAGVSAAALPDDMDAAIRLPTDVIGGGVADVVTAMAAATEEERPWECCDMAMCMRSWPPLCRCLDEVDRCSGACKRCEKTGGDSRRRTCADWYKGQPGPQCHHRKAAAADEEKERDGEGGEKRPWKCCSMPICTRSQPPICHCWDEVKRCSSACQHCDKVSSSSSSGQHRYRCLDTHRGDPGPRCAEEE